jgi:voltage-gated potassium channel
MIREYRLARDSLAKALKRMGNLLPSTSPKRDLNLKHLSLVVLLLGLLLFRPLLPSAVANAIFLPSIIVAAWLAGGRTHRGLVMAMFSGAATFALLVIQVVAYDRLPLIVTQPVGFLVSIAVLGLLGYSGAVLLHSLLSTDRISVDEIVGTFNIYLIMGYAWSYVYVLLELWAPGSFEPAAPEQHLSLHFIYFSFTTLTTVGFGDIAPVSPFARMLVVLEAIVGQFYVAVVVAYLVSMYITHNLASKNTDDGA